MLLISVNMIHCPPYSNEVLLYFPSVINSDTMNCYAFNTILYEDMTCIIHAHAHRHTCACTLPYTHKHMHTHTNVHVHLHTHTHTHTLLFFFINTTHYSCPLSKHGAHATWIEQSTKVLIQIPNENHTTKSMLLPCVTWMYTSNSEDTYIYGIIVILQGTILITSHVGTFYSFRLVENLHGCSLISGVPFRDRNRLLPGLVHSYFLLSVLHWLVQ